MMNKNIQSSLSALLKLPVLVLLLMAFAYSPDAASQTWGNPKPDGSDSLNYVLTEMARGAALKGTNGITLGPDGYLYVASVLGQEIVVMDRENGTIVKRLGKALGIKSPDDLVFGPDGSLYWTDLLVGEVGRMTPDGLVTKQWVAAGVNPIAFSPDGRLFVALDFQGDGLYELDPALVEPPRPIIVSTPEKPYPLGFLNAFGFGPDGHLYGPLFAAGLVIRVDVGNPGDPVSTDPFTDGTIQTIGSGFQNPASAKFGPDGNLYVLDQTGEVFKIDTPTGEKTMFTTLEPGLDNMVFDAKGTLYITNADEGWVVRVLSGGQSRTISPGGMIAPSGLAVLAGPEGGDKLYVADLFRLRQFNGRSGKQEHVDKGFLVPKEKSSSLTLPMNVSTDGNHLLVSSWFSGAVQVWDPRAQKVLEHYDMAAPVAAIRFGDDILVSDVGLGGVVRASDHSMILPIDNTTIFAPGGLATDGETVWVADWGSGTIMQIGFEGDTPNTPVVLASGLKNPEGLAFDHAGGLVVVESGAARLSRIDLSTGEVTTMVEDLELSAPGLEGMPPTWIFDGVAMGQSGDIYVSGGGSNIIYRVSRE